MKLIITVLFVTAVLLLYTRWEIRLNQRACAECGARVSIDNPDAACPSCGASFTNKGAGEVSEKGGGGE
jgi:hypothetical protein